MLKIKKTGSFKAEEYNKFSIGDKGNIVFHVGGDWGTSYLMIHQFKTGQTCQMKSELPEGIDHFIEHFQESERIYLIYIYNRYRTQVVVYKFDIEVNLAERVYESLQHKFLIVDGHIFELDQVGQLRVLIKSRDIILKRTFQNISSVNIIYRKEGNLLQITSHGHVEYFTITDINEVQLQDRPPRVLKRQLTTFIKQEPEQQFQPLQLKLCSSIKQNDCYCSKDCFYNSTIIDIHKLMITKSKIINLKRQPKLLRILKKYYPDENFLAPRYIISSYQDEDIDHQIFVCDITTAEQEFIGLYNTVGVRDGYLLNLLSDDGEESSYHVYQVESI